MSLMSTTCSPDSRKDSCSCVPRRDEFLASLLANAQVATVYYTGPKLSGAELRQITAQGATIFVHQRRPALVDVFAKTIVAFEGVAGSASAKSVEQIDPALRVSWCGLYCGGSHAIQKQLAQAARKWGVGWQAELFDW